MGTSDDNQKSGYNGPQSQGGIREETVEAARNDPHPERAGLPGGQLGDRPERAERSLDEGDSAETPGFTGDDARHQPVDETGEAPPPNRDPAAGLGGAVDEQPDAPNRGRPKHGLDDDAETDPGRPVNPQRTEIPARHDPSFQTGGSGETNAQHIRNRNVADEQSKAQRKARGDSAPGDPIHPDGKD